MPDPLPRQPPDGELPDALAADLATLYRSTVSVPPALDDAILSDARAGVAGRLRFRRTLRWVSAGVGAAAAAGVVLVVSLVGPWEGGRTQSEHAVAGAPPAREDIDRNGRVDIIDAFVVAKRVDAGSSADAQAAWDVTGDGRVDRRDVDRIAAVAVAVLDTRSVRGGSLQ